MVYADFHTLVDKAIVIENKRHEMEEKRRRMKSQSIDNDTNPCYTTAPKFQKWYQESTSQWDVDPQELQQYPQKHQFEDQTLLQGQLNNVPMQDNISNTLTTGKECYHCGELGHYANKCPQKCTQQPRHRNKVQWDYIFGKVNHVTIGTTQRASDVVISTFLVNSNPTLVLFDYGASHSFISADFEKRNTLTTQTTKKAVLVKSLDGKRIATLRCPKVGLNLSGVDFRANLLVLNSTSIDVTLGIDWLTAHDAVI
jgi:hypothetical protein